MAGKYAHLIDKLPRDSGIEPERQAKINVVKDEILKPRAPEDSASNRALRDSTLEIIGKIQKLNDNLLILLYESSPERLAAAYCDVRQAKEDVEDTLSQTQLILDAYSQLMIDAYTRAHITSVKLDVDMIRGAPSVRIEDEPSIKVTDHDAVREWAIATGLERSLAFPWQTLNSLAKDLLLKGEDTPPGTVMKVRTKIVRKK